MLSSFQRPHYYACHIWPCSGPPRPCFLFSPQGIGCQRGGWMVWHSSIRSTLELKWDRPKKSKGQCDSCKMPASWTNRLINITKEGIYYSDQAKMLHGLKCELFGVKRYHCSVYWTSHPTGRKCISSDALMPKKRSCGTGVVWNQQLYPTQQQQHCIKLAEVVPSRGCTTVMNGLWYFCLSPFSFS